MSCLCERQPLFSVSEPLQLSPKKTWEGFIGGFFSTVVFGFIVSTLDLLLRLTHVVISPSTHSLKAGKCVFVIFVQYLPVTETSQPNTLIKHNETSKLVDYLHEF